VGARVREGSILATTYQTWSERLRTALDLVATVMIIVCSIASGTEVHILANPPICDEYCTQSTACEDRCYVNMMEYENGNSISCYQYGVYDTSVACCGNGVCEQGDGDHEMNSCASDCPQTYTCGDCDINAQDCGGELVCIQGGCCVTGCDGEDCGEKDRSCEGGASACASDNDCCPDEFCLSVTCLNCYPEPVLFGPQCSPNPYNPT
jgi:hypothetical protein